MSANARVVIVNENDDSKVSVTDRGLKGAMSVEIVDASGNQITSFGGGTQYVFGTDTYTETTTVATMAGAVRNDVLATLVNNDNEIAPLQVNDLGALYTTVTSIIPGTKTINLGKAIDNVAGSTDTGIMVLAVRDDTLTTLTPVDGDYVSLRVNSTGALHVTGGGGGTEYTEGDTDASITGSAIMWEDGSDTLRAVSAAKPFPVDIISQVPGTGATNLGKQEDEAHSSGDVGVMALGVRKDEPAVIATDGDYHPLLTSEVGALWTEHVPNEVDSGNSTTSTLTSASTFTGTGIDILHHDIVTITMDASHDSATDGMTFQFSTDNSNWDDVYPFTYTAADGARRFQFPVTSQYFRVVYTNGGTNQTHFRLQTIFHHANTLTTIHRLVDDTSPDRSAQIVKAAIIAQQGGGGPGAGDFIAVQATAGGNLRTSVQEISDGLDIGAANAGSETQRVSISTDDVNLSAIKSATELSDNVVAVLGTATYTETTTSGNVIGVVRNDALATLAGTDNEIAPLQVNASGALYTVLSAGTSEIGKLAAGTAGIGKLTANSGVDIGDVDVTSLPDTLQGPGAVSIDSYTQKSINLTTGNDQVLVASAANKQIWVYGYGFTCGDADGQSVSFQDQDDLALSGIMEFSQYGGMAVAPSGNFAMPIWKLGTDKDLEVDITGGDVDGWIAYAILSV